MPARDTYLGIDLGTTALKAAIFEARSGRMLAAAGKALRTRVGPNGEREQSAEAILRALAEALKELRKRAPGSWKIIAGVALASQGGSAVIADRETGKALTPLWPWNDTRPFAYLPRVREALGRGFWRRRTMRDDPGAGLGRMLWLKEEKPHLFDKKHIYAGAGEFLFFHLTGAWRQDAGSALQIGCYDSRAAKLMPEPLHAVGTDVGFVAPMREGHSLLALTPDAARRFGLPVGLPVAGPYLDHEAGFMAAGGVSDRPLQCSLGTAWVGNFVMEEGAKWTSPFQLVLPSPTRAGHLVVQPLLTGNVSWEWGLTTLVHGDLKEAIRRSAGIFRKAMWPEGELVCIPWLARPNHLAEGAFGAGLFQGVHPRTDRGDLLRALAAGMAFEFYRVFEAVHKEHITDAIVLGGGAAGSEFFRMAFAALFASIPAYVFTDYEHAGARGAICAFDRAAAAAPVERIKRPPADTIREAHRRYAAYKGAFERLYGDVACGGAIAIGHK